MSDYDRLFREFSKGRMSPFYKEMYPGLLLYASRILGSDLAYLSEDCVQDAVMNTFLSLQEIENHLHWRRYLVTSIRNRALKILAHHNVVENFVANTDASDIERDISHEIIRQETLDMLHEAIQSLPDIYRKVFDLSFEEGLRNQEIAQMLDIAEVTVKKRKAKLLQILRDKLGDIPADELSMLLMIYGAVYKI